MKTVSPGLAASCACWIVANGLVIVPAFESLPSGATKYSAADRFCTISKNASDTIFIGDRLRHNSAMQNSWLYYALASAIFAAAINVLAKFGMKDVDKDFATAIRSVVQALVVVGFASVVGVMKNFGQLHGRAMASITATGICGGLSWICVFRALQLAEASKVGPIDKLSMPLGIVLAVIFLHERPSNINWVGIVLMATGAYFAAHK